MSKGLLDVSSIIHDAELQSGQRGKLDDILRTRMSEFIDSIVREKPDLSEFDQIATRKQITKVLVTRLKLAADRERYPEIALERIERPIFVVGFPRTGTSLLYSLLAEDPDSRSPLWWHTHHPSPPPGEGPVERFRFEDTQREMDRYLAAIPGLLDLHPYYDKREFSLCEDEHVFSLGFQQRYPANYYDIPVNTTFPGVPDTAEAFRFHKEFLQHLQWNQPRRHWVCKGTMHQFNLDALFHEYPDALCLWPHRDPVATHMSSLTMIAVCINGVTRGGFDAKSYARAYMEDVRKGIDHVLSNPLTDDPRVVHVQFKDTSSDPISAISAAYDHWGIPVTPAFRAGMQAWLDDPSNRSSRYARYQYDMEYFGLDKNEVKDLFRDYEERFL